VGERAFVFPSGSDSTVEGVSIPDRETLTALIARDMTVVQIASTLEWSPRRVRYWLRRHGLNTIDWSGVSEQLTGEREATRTCKTHGRTTFVLEGRGYYRCSRCRQDRVLASRRRTRRRLIAEAGGGCAICGYARCIGALAFHHVDPSEKEFGLSWRGLTRSLEDLRKEARKCVLLCSNCHAEVEAGMISVAERRSQIPLSCELVAE